VSERIYIDYRYRHSETSGIVSNVNRTYTLAMKTPKDNKNKITIKLSWESEITIEQLASVLVPLLTAGWVTFQAFIPHNTQNSIPVLPPSQTPIVQIDRQPTAHSRRFG
jgi:hypothetical protein